jgi:hypothetical protein
MTRIIRTRTIHLVETIEVSEHPSAQPSAPVDTTGDELSTSAVMPIARCTAELTRRLGSLESWYRRQEAAGR